MAGTPTFFPEGHEPRQTDTEHILLLKILGALIDEGGGTDTGLTFGSGAPVGAPTATHAVYFDDDATSPTGGLFWVWDPALLKWFSSFGI